MSMPTPSFSSGENMMSSKASPTMVCRVDISTVNAQPRSTSYNMHVLNMYVLGMQNPGDTILKQEQTLMPLQSLKDHICHEAFVWRLWSSSEVMLNGSRKLVPCSKLMAEVRMAVHYLCRRFLEQDKCTAHRLSA